MHCQPASSRLLQSALNQRQTALRLLSQQFVLLAAALADAVELVSNGQGCEDCGSLCVHRGCGVGDGAHLGVYIGGELLDVALVELTTDPVSLPENLHFHRVHGKHHTTSSASGSLTRTSDFSKAAGTTARRRWSYFASDVDICRIVRGTSASCTPTLAYSDHHYCNVTNTWMTPVSSRKGSSALPTTAPSIWPRSVPFIARPGVDEVTRRSPAAIAPFSVVTLHGTIP